MSTKLKKEVFGYIISGILATGSDYLVYNTIIHFSNIYVIAKAISFFMGTVIAFFYNKYITFKVPYHSKSEIIKFFSLYITSMLVNVSINRFAIWGLNGIFALKISINLAFLFATIITVVINFLGQKFWVFKKH